MATHFVSIKVQLTLIGALAVLGLALLLSTLLASEYRDLQSEREITEDIRLIGLHAELIHELQRERGLSAGYMARRDPELAAQLATQRRHTDDALAALGTHEPDAVSRVNDHLDPIRSAVDRGTAHYPREYHRYSELMNERLDHVRALGYTADRGQLLGALIAHTHLMVVKEVLGRVRATVFHGLRDDRGNTEVVREAARLEALLAESLRLLERDGRAAVSDRVAEQLDEGDGAHVLAALEATARGELAAADASEADWYPRSTALIDHFHTIESDSLAWLQQQGETRLQEMERRLWALGAVALLLGGGIIALVLYAIRCLVLDLTRLVAGVREIGTSHDFSNRLTIERRHDEIGTIAGVFNELLGVVEELLAEQAHLASTDQLTGLANRRRFDEALQHEAARSQRLATPLGLIMLDIDHFKAINDQYGHEVGDQVLVRLAEVINDTLRATDIPARWGGEEFAVLAPDTDDEHGCRLAERLRQQVAAHVFPGVGSLTISAGVACLGGDGDTEALLRRADEALYTAKQAGRDCTRCV